MIVKEIVDNQLFVYKIHSGGKKELIYKRWINKNYGMVFCKYGNFTSGEMRGALTNKKNLKK